MHFLTFFKRFQTTEDNLHVLDCVSVRGGRIL